jgi:hypothetical protein
MDTNLDSVLLDFSIVKNMKLKDVSVTNPNFDTGLVVITDKDTVKHLSNLPLGKERIDYVENKDFVKKIQDTVYIFYNKKRKVCVLQNNVTSIQLICKSILSGLPSDTIIWVSLDFFEKDWMEVLNTFIKNGFSDPYISIVNPMFETIKPSICLTRLNIIKSTEVDSKTVLNQVLYCIEQYKSNSKSCFLHAKLSKQALDYLKIASKIGVTVDSKGKSSQKEISGELVVKDVVRKQNTFVYIINLDKKSIKSGEEENVNVNAVRYNFHSHPREAYIRLSVEKAWPSVLDYLGYYQLGENTIFHCVATLEGLYILSFTSSWAGRKKENSKAVLDFIDKNFDIDHKEPYTPEEYVKKVNKILYNKTSIFDVKFRKWEDSNKPFKVFFPMIGSSCLVTQDIVNNYRKVHLKQ